MPAEPAERPRDRTGAARQRRYRERKLLEAEGIRLVRGDLRLDQASLDALVTAGIFPETATDAELLAAIPRLLDFLAEPLVIEALQQAMEGLAVELGFGA